MNIKLALVQVSVGTDIKENQEKVEHILTKASKEGAKLALIPELYLGHYFCKNQNENNFSKAHEVDNHPVLSSMMALSKKLKLVVPFSFFEKSGPEYFNSVAMIDRGNILGIYRKSHIPDGPGYQEKYYFRPGNTGFKVFHTSVAPLGLGICWDQWFPECARILTLMGAEILLYPTAIGSEPDNHLLNTKDPWQRVMVGHAVSNMIFLAAANRVGTEDGQRFYGHSFISDYFGNIICEMGSKTQGFKIAQINLDDAKKERNAFGFFRDRRVDLYSKLLE